MHAVVSLSINWQKLKQSKSIVEFGQRDHLFSSLSFLYKRKKRKMASTMWPLFKNEGSRCWTWQFYYYWVIINLRTMLPQNKVLWLKNWYASKCKPHTEDMEENRKLLFWWIKKWHETRKKIKPMFRSR